MLVCLVPRDTPEHGPVRAGRNSRRRRLLLLLLFFAAFSIRLIHLTEIRESPFYDSPIVDALTHHEEAMRLVGGGGEVPSGPYWKAPLYPWFLAAVYAVAGNGAFAPRLLQFLLGSLSPILVFLIARRVFGSATAWVAAGITAIYPLFYYFEGQLLIPPVTIVLILTALLLLLGTPQSRRPILFALAAGLVIGLAALARSQILLFVPLAGFWLFTHVDRYHRPFNGRRGAAALAGFLIPIILLVGGVTIRNKTVTGESVFLTANSGINFYVGNGPDSDGMSAVPVGSRWQRLKRMARVADDGEMDVSHSRRSTWYFSEVFRFARAEPQAFLTLQLRKLYLFWSSLEIRNNIDIYFFRQWSGMLRLSVGRFGTIGLPYALLAPLALTAILIPPSRVTAGGQRRARTLLVLYVFGYMAAVCAFFVCTRFRMPVLPVLICFAADAAVRSASTLKRVGVLGLLRPARPLGAVFTFLLLAVLFNLDLGGVRHTLPSARDELNLAASLRARGDGAEAIAAVYRGLAIDRSDPDAYHLLGVLCGESGHLDHAVEALRKALVHDPEYATAHHALGITYRNQHKGRLALEAFERAVYCDPWFPEARVDLGTAYLRRGEFEKAAENYEVALIMNPSRDDIRFWLAEARRRAAR